MLEIKWLGHAGFKIYTENCEIVIDPFLENNPQTNISIDEIGKPDYVCVTHDHDDHLGDSLKICKKTGSKLISNFELTQYAEEKGVENTIPMNIGGKTELKNLEIIMTKAFHTAEIGTPSGFVFNFQNSTVYHAGDTDIFHDMKLIKELYHPEIALLPIGGRFTMGPKKAVKSLELINPDYVIPMHYATLPELEDSPEAFLKTLDACKNIDTTPIVLENGESWNY